MMYKKFRKNFIVPALCVSILAQGPAGIMAASFNDANAHWAKDAIEIWSDYEVVQGSDGMFRPDDNITRAELAVMINRIMNYQEKAANSFRDLPETWYTDAVLKLVQYGVMTGYNGEIRPQDPVTREEALVMMARALGVKNNAARSVSFVDSSSVSEWARDAVEAMTARGFIRGYEDGSFRPQDAMTRACSITVVNNSIKGFYHKPGTYQADKVDGIVIVNTPGVILEGMTIEGDLIVAPGVTDGKVELKDTTVKGEQIVVVPNPGGGSGDNGTGGGNEQPGTPTPTSTPVPTSTPAPTSNPGGGSSGGGGGSSIQTAASNDIIVNDSYEGKSGMVTVNRKRYTIGKNAFATLEEAVKQVETLDKQATITLHSDLTLESTLVLEVDDLTLDGGGRTLTFPQGVNDGIQLVQNSGIKVQNLKIQMQDETGKWNGSYALQAYEAAATVKDVTLTGADAGLLVNGAQVTLQGVVDVSGNEFGGIEVSKGSLAQKTPLLTGAARNLKNDTEADPGKPTVWIDKVSELTRDVMQVTGLREGTTEKDQAHYFLGAAPVVDSAQVANLEQLQQALEKEDIKTIYLTADIVSDQTLVVTRAVSIQGQDGVKTLSFEKKNGIQLVNAGGVKLENVKVEVTGQEEGWQGLYALQAYGATNATVKDVALTGADAGLLVNGAQVTLQGVVDVSGNEFGGIEVSKGSLVESMPLLTGDASNLKNDTEADPGKPTVWIDKVSELTRDVMQVTGLREGTTEKDQAHYFLGAAPVVDSAQVADLDEFKAALANEDIKTIHLTADIACSETLEISRAVSIFGQDSVRTLSFEKKNGIRLVNAGDVRLENVKVEVTGQEMGWQGLYALQAYGATNAALKDVALTGADGGLLVNGAQVALEGVVDVSGNEFGGIEVAKGVDVQSTPLLSGTAANLKNDSEQNPDKPTVWIDKVSELTNAVVQVSGLHEVAASGKDQAHFFLQEVLLP